MFTVSIDMVEFTSTILFCFPYASGIFCSYFPSLLHFIIVSGYFLMYYFHFFNDILFFFYFSFLRKAYMKSLMALELTKYLLIYHTLLQIY